MRKVIVIGGSSGAIQGLCTLLERLPADLPAAVLAVIHTTEESSHLPEVLKRCGSLDVVAPPKAAPISAGCLYIPAPNRHLIVRSQCAVSWMGPRENRHRPAVDALFRTAARAFRKNVIAVVLSGALDDGSAGSLAVKARGGTVVVQDPSEATVQDMPKNVLRQVETDHCLTLDGIASFLTKASAKGPSIKTRKPSRAECDRVSAASFSEVEPPGFTCPECGGVVMQIQNGKNVQFRCHVGHTFSLQNFTEAHADALERALWVALRKLNEQHTLQGHLATTSRGGIDLRKRHQENADAAARDMQLLHEILARL